MDALLNKIKANILEYNSEFSNIWNDNQRTVLDAEKKLNHPPCDEKSSDGAKLQHILNLLQK